MQFRTFLQTALVLTSVLFLTNAAQAQELPAASPVTPPPTMSEEQQMLNNLPESVKAQMKPGVRYTIGAKTTAGWENQLVKGNAGLKHFYWSPVTSMVQASPSQRTKVQAISAAPQQPRQEFHYKKPGRAALPHNPYLDICAKKATAGALQPNRNSKDVSANLAYKKSRSSEDVNGQLVSTDTKAKLYADYPSYKNSNSVNGNLTSQQVAGKLLNN